MSVPTGTKAIELVQTLNARFRAAQRYLEPKIAECKATINAYLNKGPISDPLAISVKTGRLMKDSETIHPRDVRALLGDTPYFPYEAVRKATIPNLQARALTDLCDYYTGQPSIRGDFYTAFSDALHQARPFGKVYIWPHWDYWPVSIFQRLPETDPVTGEIVGISEFKAIDIQQRLVWDVLPVWQVFVSRHGETLDAKPWMFIQLRVHLSELLPRLDRGRDESGYDLVRDGKRVKWSDIKSRSQGHDTDWAAGQLRMDSGNEPGEFSDDVGTLLIYIEVPTKEFPAGREIHYLNYDTLLYSEDRSDWNMPLWQKPIVELNHVMHIGPDKYFGIGLWSIIRDRVLISEESLSQYVDHIFRSSTGTILYDRRVSESLLARIIGGNIPIDRQSGESLNDFVQPLNWGDPPTGLVDVAQRMDQSIDESDGINDYISGDVPPRKETATATSTLANAASVRVEHATSYIERTAFTRIGTMNPKIIDRHLTQYEKKRILGAEKARLLMSVDPDMIPGGWSLRFMGSDKIRSQAQRFDRKMRAFDMTANLLPPGGQGQQYFVREILESGDVDPETVDIIMDEIAAYFNQGGQQGEQQGGLESMSRSGGTVTGMQQGPSPGSAAAMQSMAAQGVQA